MHLSSIPYTQAVTKWTRLWSLVTSVPISLDPLILFTVSPVMSGVVVIPQPAAL